MMQTPPLVALVEKADGVLERDTQGLRFRKALTVSGDGSKRP
jgi:hypothetical protein